MATNTAAARIDELIDREQWDKARQLITQELGHEPDNHWLLTQLGVTYYERKNYKKALAQFDKALAIVPDCPLTLWNLAGTLDALGQSRWALEIYTQLLQSKKTLADDPCWESTEWADKLKTDCVFRIALCFEHLDEHDKAETCFRQYVTLLAHGLEGSYSAEEALAHLRGNEQSDQDAAEAELSKDAREVARATGRRSYAATNSVNRRRIAALQDSFKSQALPLQPQQ